MKSQAFLLTLLENVVFSERNATTGGHRGLDYIPGASLLGAAAARLYADSMSSDEQWQIFHSGQVRFGNGLPLSPAGSVCYPVPACWHYEKHGSKPAIDGKFEANSVFNLQYVRPLPSQPEAIKAGFVGRDGSHVIPHRQLSLKTAINKATGRRREAALFGYEALTAGQRFAALLEADDNIDQTLFDRVCDSLVNDALYLGRSRRTEYGTVCCEKIEGATVQPLPASAAYPQSTLVLWLLSDLALDDENGGPTLEPSPALLDVDLPPGKLTPDQSFIRARRVTLYNRYLRRYDVERTVIAQGSVLTFKFDQSPSQDSIGKLVEGIGLWRELGLGRVWVNSPLLEETLTFENGTTTPIIAATDPWAGISEPDGEDYEANLVAWLGTRAERRSVAEKCGTEVSQWLAELKTLYAVGRALAGKSSDEEFGPGASQWGRVLDAARLPAATPENISATLFEGRNAICRGEGLQKNGTPEWKADPDWAAQAELDGKQTTFRGWLKSRVDLWLKRHHNDPLRPEFGTVVGKVAGDARAFLQAQTKGRKRQELAE
ncbi:MAG: hypothetical protein WAS73_01135 [Defluviicoccus sp.]